MASVSISCPSCSATDGVVRNGKSTAGHQRYLCSHCRFRIIKCQFGFIKARYKGLTKNDSQLAMLFTLANLFKVDQMLRRQPRSV